MNNINENKKPTSFILLENGLQELTMQLVDGDIDSIARKAKISQSSVIRYTKGKSVKKFNVGKKILDIGRAIVIDRENSLKTA